jgi:phage gp29-like protein
MKEVSKLPKKLPPPALGLQMPPMPAVIGTPGSVTTQHVELWDRFITHPGTGVEPQNIVQIYRSAESGFPQEQCDLFDDIIENDGHLRSLLEVRSLAVAGKAWQIKAGGNAAIDVAAAERLEIALRDTNFDDLVSHILSARPFGWAGSEIVWVEVNGDFVPGWFINVPKRRFRFDEQDRPRLLNASGDFEGELLKPGQWVWATNPGAGLTVRGGLMRTGTWYGLFKRWSWRDWVIYAEKFGIPLVLGKYENDASEDQKGELQATVEDIGEAGQAIMSEQATVEIHEAQRGGDSTGLHKSIVNARESPRVSIIRSRRG